jgi:chemotaxis protein MotB
LSSGSAQINRNAAPLLEEFASIMNVEDASRLKILVVGHTDDKQIVKRSTANRHPTNWHLSTNRANSVLLALNKYGINEARMGAAGYSMYQPVAPNTDEHARTLNRRVEIYVLAPDAVVAGWDPATSVR